MRKKVTQVGRDLSSLLDVGMVVMHIDATDKSVDVPAMFKNNNHLVLNLSYRFASADIELGTNRVVATLTFGAEKYRCRIGYRAIFILQSAVNGAIAVFPENMPEDLLAALEKNMPMEDGSKLRVVPAGRAKESGNSVKKRTPRPKLQLVDGGLTD